MTPVTGPARPLSLLPNRLEESSSRERQRYLIARILEGDRPSLSNPNFDSLSVNDRLSRITSAERRRIAEEAGNSFHTLASLSEESIPEYFYEGLLRAGRRAEDEDRFGVAQRCYLFLSRLRGGGITVPPHIQNQARERLAVLNGGGSRWERVEFGLHRLPGQTLDPTFLIGMGVASVVARGLRLGILARAGSATPRFLPRIFEAGALATAESAAFIGAERASAAILGQPSSSASAPEEWLRYGFPMFLGSRLLGTVSGQLYRRGRFRQAWLRDGSLAGARLRHRLGYGIVTQASIFGAAYFAQGLESREAASERRPHDGVAQALVWTLAFSAFNSTARRMSGSRSIAWERSLFRR